MPKGLVRTKRDERLWEQAKAQVREEHPDVEEESDRFYRLVNGIYQKMKGGQVEKAGRGPGKGLGLARGRGLMDGTGPRAGTPACPVRKAVVVVRHPAGTEPPPDEGARPVGTAGRPLLGRVALGDLLKAAAQLGLFDETAHPRAPKGSGKGGRFVPKGGTPTRNPALGGVPRSGPLLDAWDLNVVGRYSGRPQGVLLTIFGSRRPAPEDMPGATYVRDISRAHFADDDEAAVEVLRTLQGSGLVRNMQNERWWGLTDEGLRRAQALVREARNEEGALYKSARPLLGVLIGGRRDV